MAAARLPTAPCLPAAPRLTSGAEIVAHLAAVLRESGRFRVVGIVSPVPPADLPSQARQEGEFARALRRTRRAHGRTRPLQKDEAP